MDALAFFGRVAIITLIFLLLNIDYIAVINSVYQKIFQNSSLWNVQKFDKKTSTRNANINSNHREQRHWAEPRLVRIPGFHDGTVFLNLDEQIEEDTIEKLGLFKSKYEVLEVLKEHCLPKLICEMSATSHKNILSTSEQELLNLIRQSTVMVYGTVTSRYHYAAHMGQLISGMEGQGCHNFYPSCPFQSLQVLRMIRRTRTTSALRNSLRR